MVIHSSFADFVLFLYVHMANVDGEFHALEENLILDKAQKLFPETAQAKTRLQQEADRYKSVNPDSIPDIIRDTFKHYGGIKFSQKYRIYTDMYDIINADGRVDASETRAIGELKQIIELAAGR